jgi:hypothetical protein
MNELLDREACSYGMCFLSGRKDVSGHGEQQQHTAQQTAQQHATPRDMRVDERAAKQFCVMRCEDTSGPGLLVSESPTEARYVCKPVKSPTRVFGSQCA